MPVTTRQTAWLAGWLAVVLLTASTARASSLQIESAQIVPKGPLWEITPALRWQVDAPVIEAIHSGVALRFQIKARLLQTRPWWPDTILAQHNQAVEVRYFSLSKQYLLKNLANGQQRGFLQLTNLWHHMDKLASMQLPQQAGADVVSLRVRLDTGALPAAMQLPVLLDRAWHLDSGWRLFTLPSDSAENKRVSP